MLELLHSLDLSLFDRYLPSADADIDRAEDDVQDVDQEQGSQGAQEEPTKVILDLYFINIGSETGQHVHHQ